MRILEILFLVSVTGLLITLFTKYYSIKKWTFYSSVLFVVLQIFIENIRWQMYLGYIALIIGILIFYTPILKKWAKIIGLSFGLLFCVLSVVLGVMMPVMKFPKPTGKYTVGLKTLYMEDTTRLEVFTAAEEDHRKVTVHVWYPSNQKVTNPERYMDQGYAEAFAVSKSMPSFITGHFNLTKTHIEKSLDIAEDQQFPVIVLSHGLLWNCEMYTTIIEEIVSRGYIVFGIDHLYESFLTEYQGKRIKWNDKNLKNMDTQMDFDYVTTTTALFRKEKDTAKKQELLYNLIQHVPYFESLDRWSSDVSFVINQITLLNSDVNSIFYQKLDVDRIGLLGHSWGGTAVVQKASTDNRIKAVINLDGAQWGRAIDNQLHVPLMAIYADRDYEQFFTPNFDVYDYISKNDYYSVTIQLSNHTNFGDMSYWTKLNSLTQTGTIDPERMTRITNELVLSFFDRYVKDKNLNLLHHFSKNKYPEISILQKNKLPQNGLK